jgi:SAM-dependent methyltransferase
LAEFTGERVIPGEVEIDLWNEHVARYAFAARLAADLRVADIACGTGYGSATLAQSARIVVGIDIAPDALDWARAHYIRSNLAFVQASASTLPLAAASIDLAVSFETIEHLPDWRAFLAEIRRVLAPGGRFVVSTPNLALYTESRGITGPNPFHFHEFEFEEFEGELRYVFPHVSMFLQNHVAGIGFQPVGRPSAPPGLQAAPAEAAARDANFFVAVCSRAPREPVPGFVYLPAAANVLRERERHIWMLETDLAALRNEKHNLVEMFRAQKEQLDNSNRWAGELDEKLRAAQARIVELQEEERRRTEWAQNLQQELDRAGAELTHCVALLDKAENTVVERTNWAKELDARARELQAKLDLVKSSLWVKAGRALGIVKLPRG